MADYQLAATLAKWREVEQAATAGPWGTLERHGRDIADEGWSDVRIVGGPESEPIAVAYLTDILETDSNEADTEFIVTARTALPLLLAALDAVRKLADELEATPYPDATAIQDCEVIRTDLARGLGRIFRAAITAALTKGEAAP
jgi:hypothetical protein